jgi:hypothetical protein
LGMSFFLTGEMVEYVGLEKKGILLQFSNRPDKLNRAPA